MFDSGTYIEICLPLAHQVVWRQEQQLDHRTSYCGRTRGASQYQKDLHLQKLQEDTPRVQPIKELNVSCPL